MNRLRDYKLPELREEIKRWCLFENRMESLVSKWESYKTDKDRARFLKTLSFYTKQKLMGYLLNGKNSNPNWRCGE